jgi:hypothetical protein
MKMTPAEKSMGVFFILVIGCLFVNSEHGDVKAPYILIGRLQRDKHLKYYQYSAEKVRYKLG